MTANPFDGLAAMLRTPQVLADRYELRSNLGRGGMGVVYLAQDRVLGREVAIKLVEPALLGDDTTRRLKDEARLIGELAHPGIVPVHDLGQLDDGMVYYVMEVVRGATLAEWIRHSHSLQEKLRLFERVCQPVAFAHARGIAHRDLKPTNIMIGEFGQVLVMDWGLARRCALAIAATDNEARVGTPGYRAPTSHSEVVNLIADDVYALGAVLHFTLTGRDPQQLADLHPRAVDPRVEVRLDAICALATHAAAKRRYATVLELQADIAAYLDGAAVRAYPERWYHAALRWSRRNVWLLALLGAYLAMRIAVAVFSG